ncbi:KaiC domain-containing protein [Halobacterium wangiae]|uniref:KaiC domain-containing protein n=1 Tax=Halobacterium wangiae TaxID=2902623 RepID=UPI001E58803F|nr:KaiC domain-containing protein [Halobacterium wangiae]
MAEDDEDWFEQAFDDEAEESADHSGDSPADADDDPPTEADADEPSADADDEAVETDTADVDDAPDDSDTDEAEDTADESVDPTDALDLGDEPAPDAAESESGGDDSDDFADAFGGGEPGGGDDLFEDDFADAFGGGGAPGGGDETFGFDIDGDAGAGAPGGFEEDEEYDSDIPRIDIGIDGLDEMIQGGVPERSLMVAVGEAGTGKTTFGLQFLYEAVQNGDRAVFITLEESRERVIKSAVDKGWEFDRHTEAGDLAVIDIDPIEMANSLTSIRNELPRLVEEFGASRLVLDSVSLLEMMYDDQSKRRTEIYDFTKSLKEAGVTTMLTSEASEDNPFASRYGIIEYLTDAVVVLRYIRPEDFRETRLAVEIQKIRDANHSRETKPYEITHQGISVYRQANIF